MPSDATHRSLSAVALLALVAALTVSATGAAAQANPACGGDSDRLTVPDGQTVYSDGFENGTTGDWSGGESFTVGEAGDCSLGVLEANDTTLSRSVNASGERLVGTLDVADGGALRLVNANDSGTVVTLRNLGPGSERTVELVVERDGAVEAHRALTPDSGRFFDFRLYWGTDGRVRLALDSVYAPPAAEWAADLNTSAEVDRYRVELVGEAYLDRVGVVRPETADPSTPDDPFEDDDDGSSDGWDMDGPTMRDDDRDDDSGSDGTGVIGFMLVIFGLPGALFPYQLARFGEQLDAIGSTTPADEVEPADWNVALTRVVGLGLILFGVLLIAGAIL